MSSDEFHFSSPAPASTPPFANPAFPDGASLPFVGRAREMDLLRDAAALAASGRTTLVLIAGEAGIGKTRLAEQFVALATSRGEMALWGRCWEGAGVQGFWPWVQIIRAFARDRHASETLTVLGDQRADIVRIVPDLANLAPAESKAPPPLHVMQERFAVFDTIASLLRNISLTTPVVVILDDIHWADPASIALLEFIVNQLTESRLLVLATYRDSEVTSRHPLCATLAELSRHNSARRITLSELNRSATDALIAACCDLQPHEVAHNTLCERSEGNPFFLIELLRFLATETDEQNSRRRHLASIIPASVRDIIVRRLHHISADTKLMLTVAAVMGREFEMRLVQCVSGIRPETLLDCIDEAVAARILTRSGDVVEKCRFAHIMFQEVLYDCISTRRRREMHRTIAGILESLHRNDLDACAGELAYHYLRSSNGETVATAIQYCIRAGEYASARLAYEEAVKYYQQALSLTDLTPDSERRSCELLLAIGDAYNQSGAWQEARRCFDRAGQSAKRMDAPELFARAAIGYKGLSWFTSPIDTRCVEMLQEAAAMLPVEPSIERLRLMHSLSMLLYFVPGPERRLACEQAIEIADAIGGDVARAYALEATLVDGWRPAGLERTVDTATQTIGFADRTGRRELSFQGHLIRYASLLELGDSQGAELELRQCDLIVRDLRHPKCVWQMAVVSCGRAILRADLQEAEEALGKIGQLGRQLPGEISSHYFNLHTLLLARAEGRLASFHEVVSEIAGRHPELVHYRVALSCVYVAAGDHGAARSLASSILEPGQQRLGDDSFLLLNLALLAEVIAAVDDSRLAAVLYGIALRYRTHRIVASWGAACEGSMEHYLGLLAATLRNWSDAEGHFRRALIANRELRSPLLVVRTKIAFVELCVRRDDAAAGSEAIEWVKDAIEVCEEYRLIAPLRTALLLEDGLKRRVRLESRHEPGSEWSTRELNEGDQCGTSRPSEGRGRTNIFRKEGEYWTVVFEGTVSRLRNTRGLEHLFQLIIRPNESIHSLELTSIVGPGLTGVTRPRGAYRGSFASDAPHVVRSGDMGQVVDAHALRSYRQRLRELKGEMEQAEEFNDLARMELIRGEMDKLMTHLRVSIRRNGEVRVSGSYSERARISVRNSISSALKAIGRHDGALARHLQNAVRTGAFCSYAPERPVAWKF